MITTLLSTPQSNAPDRGQEQKSIPKGLKKGGGRQQAQVTFSEVLLRGGAENGPLAGEDAVEREQVYLSIGVSGDAGLREASAELKS